MSHARPSLLAVLLLLAWAGGCSTGDCLPEPASDDTPPRVTLAVTYTDTEGREQTLTLTGQDTTRTIQAAAGRPVSVRHAGADPEGLRRAALYATIQETVGVGVQRESFDLDPITPSCPQRTLEGTWTAPPSERERDLILSASAENWTGTRALTPNLIVHLFQP